MTKLALIAAISTNGIIGVNNELPWQISADLQHFKKLTMGKPIIMGRRTYMSIGKPLPGRTNIVMTRDTSWWAEGVEIAADLTQALAIATKIVVASGVEEMMVIGGEAVYREALPRAQRLYLTRVHIEIEGDAFFPDLDMAEWLETPVQHIDADGQTPACTFVRLDRK